MAPHAEVVLHDPVTDRILAIWNPISGRKAGDESLLVELGELFETDDDVFGPYPKSLADGRQFSSVTAVLRGSEGAIEALLCINVDRSAFQEASRLLAGFATPIQAQPHQLFEHDWIERVNELVGSYVRETGKPIHRFTRADKCKLVAKMDGAGVFGRQRSIPIVAQTLQVSRSSIYNLLADVRRGDVTTDDNAP